MGLIRTIDVMKDCVITDEYKGDGDRWYTPGYLNVSSKSGDSEGGFVNAVFAFDMDSSCCEDFDIEYTDGIYGEYFITKLEIYELDEPEDTDDIKCYDIYGKMKVKIFTDNNDVKYEWSCYNDHNGYYGHEISVEVHADGRKVFDYSNIY